MKRYQLLLSTMLSLGAMSVIPATSQAQCVEKCVLVRDETGPIWSRLRRGHGGTRMPGNPVWECTINSAGCSDEMLFDNVVLDEDGRQAATAVVCLAAKQVVELALVAPNNKTRSVTFRNPVESNDGSRKDHGSILRSETASG